ncbi:helix-turn-helix transcriptional regulator [Clostridium cochlearium]|uniref:helix-turn-helix transcriptional regulator n=1 Tax=Clostridium cochlearium TaxID=1494 RepID=UPI00214A7145|nr:helix-turn-helix transcriptional regulator [Clostridium cochlearium]MCR1971668.1 helix-turn-helix transcriptional regulator [Clostridium cochlearium]
MNETYRKKVLKYLEDNGIKQKWIAEKIGITPAYFNMWLKGKRNFGNKLLKQINNILK